MSQNANTRAGIQAVLNEVRVLRNGNQAVHQECLKMAEQSQKFDENHVKTKLLIDNVVLKSEQEEDLLKDFGQTNK